MVINVSAYGLYPRIHMRVGPIKQTLVRPRPPFCCRDPAAGAGIWCGRGHTIHTGCAARRTRAHHTAAPLCTLYAPSGHKGVIITNPMMIITNHARSQLRSATCSASDKGLYGAYLFLPEGENFLILGNGPNKH